MAYADTTDLLLGDIPLAAGFDQQLWLNRAADEIDSHLGQKYTLPLPPLAYHSQLLLRRINAQLATGRLILAIDAGNDNDLHAYGRDLIRQALSDINRIMAGVIELIGAEELPTGDARGPSLVNQDAYSAVAAFEAYTMGGARTYWRPGVR